ncbi:MAG: hypothetical protein AAGG01_23580 [Planctomycetota bacterium]
MQIPQEEQSSTSSSGSKEAFGTLPDDSESASTPDSHSSADAQTLHRVRELLFGEASSALNQRVENLENSVMQRLASMEREFEERVKSAEVELRSEFRAEVTALAAKLDDQQDRKVERADLRSLLSDLADRVGS